MLDINPQGIKLKVEGRHHQLAQAGSRATSGTEDVAKEMQCLSTRDRRMNKDDGNIQEENKEAETKHPQSRSSWIKTKSTENLFGEIVDGQKDPKSEQKQVDIQTQEALRNPKEPRPDKDLFTDDAVQVSKNIMQGNKRKTVWQRCQLSYTGKYVRRAPILTTSSKSS